MEIRILVHWGILVSCVLFLVPCILGKPFSINEAIAAEAAAKTIKLNDTVSVEPTDSSLKSQFTEHKPSKNKTHRKSYTESTDDTKVASRYTGSLRERILSKLNSIKQKRTKKLKEILLPHIKKVSPLKYKKLYQVEVPLKPKYLRPSKTRLQSRNHSIKRETGFNGKFEQKYIPLLRRFSMLVNNVLDDDSREGRDSTRHRPHATETDDMVCACNNRYSGFAKNKKTASPAKATSKRANRPAFQIKTPATTANSTPTGDLLDLRQNKNIPILLARNTTSGRRNDSRISKRSSSAFHRSPQRHIARNHGDRQHGTRCTRKITGTSTDEENPCGATRDNAGGDGANGRIFGGGDSADIEEGTKFTTVEITEAVETTTQSIGENRGDFEKSEIEDKFENNGDQTKLPEHIRGRLRGSLSADQIGNIEEPVQPDEAGEKGHDRLAEHIASDQRLIDRVRAFPGQNKTTSSENKAIISLSQTDPLMQNLTMNKSFVFIIDGYSVTRDKHGESIISGKSIRLHS